MSQAFTDINWVDPNAKGPQMPVYYKGTPREEWNPNPLEIHEASSWDLAPYYLYRDPDNSSGAGYGDYTWYKLRANSDEGRRYAQLITNAERAEYMRKHAYQKMGCVEADRVFWESRKEGKRYKIRCGTLEEKELDELMEDEDYEFEDGTEKTERIKQYWREHAHEVDELPDEYWESRCELKKDEGGEDGGTTEVMEKTNQPEEVKTEE